MASRSIHRNLRLILVLYFVGYCIDLYPQNYDECKIPLEEIIPREIINRKSYFNLESIEVGDFVYFNEKSINHLKRPGVHCKAKFLKKIKRSDLKKDPQLTMSKYYGKQKPTAIDDNTFIYHDSIFGFEVVELDYSNWIGTKDQNFESSDFFRHVTLSCKSPSESMKSDFFMIDLIDFKNKKLKVELVNSRELMLSLEDGIVIYGFGFIGLDEISAPIFQDSDLIKQRSKFEISDSIVGNFIVLENFNHYDYNLDSFDYYQIDGVQFHLDSNYVENTYLLLNKIKTGEIGNNVLGLNLNSPNINLYDFDCFNKKWSFEKSKYEEYLKASFTDKEIQSIRSGTIFLGMTENATYESIGLPIRTNETVVKNLVHKQCIYGDGIYVYIENGKVTAWQDIESLRD